jgi:hypothetical protein
MISLLNKVGLKLDFRSFTYEFALFMFVPKVFLKYSLILD